MKKQYAKKQIEEAVDLAGCRRGVVSVKLSNGHGFAIGDSNDPGTLDIVDVEGIPAKILRSTELMTLNGLHYSDGKMKTTDLESYDRIRYHYSLDAFKYDAEWGEEPIVDVDPEGRVVTLDVD